MTAHRYWRVKFFDTTGMLYVGAATIEFRASIGGADLCGSGTASASDVYGSWVAANAFDGSSATRWLSNSFYNNTHNWISYDFGLGNEVDVVELVLKSASSTGADAPRTLTLQYSDDGAVWFGKLHIYNQPAWSAYEQRVFNTNSENVVAADSLIPEMSSATDPNPYVASASSQYDSNYPAENAFNGFCSGSHYGYWLGALSGIPAWLKIDIGTAVEAFSVGLMADGNATHGYMPKDFTIEGSNDDSNWTTLVTVTGETDWTTYEHRQFDLTTTGSYRYYRIHATDNNGSAAIGLGAFFLLAEPFESPVAPPPSEFAGTKPFVFMF